jgi:tyrosine decarboxylase/aspartate 1-decarboxylase
MRAGGPELDIVVWKAASASAEIAEKRAEKLFMQAAQADLHLALVQLPLSWFEGAEVNAIKTDRSVTCLRSVLMKPEHLDWLDPIGERLSAAYAEVMRE